MKRNYSLVLMLIMLITGFSFNSVAMYDDNEVIHIDENFYIIVTVEEDNNLVRSTKTKSGTKTYTGYNGDEKVWDATLRGTFTYTGSSATCTNATISYNIYNDNWKITSATTSKSSNKAIGDITAKRYFLGIPTKTVEQTITLTCSASGTLS